MKAVNSNQQAAHALPGFKLSRKLFWTILAGGILCSILSLYIIATNQANDRTPWVHETMWGIVYIICVIVLPITAALRVRDAGYPWLFGLALPFAPVIFAACAAGIVGLQKGPSSSSPIFFETAFYLGLGISALMFGYILYILARPSAFQSGHLDPNPHEVTK